MVESGIGKEKKTAKKQLTSSSQQLCLAQVASAASEKRKKAIPVRKLLEMERQNLDPSVPTRINDENVLSDANRSSAMIQGSTGGSGSNDSATSILGSLERLVETSFKPNTTTASVDIVVAQQVMMAKRALASSVGNADTVNEDDHEAKKVKLDHDDEEWSPSSPPPVNPPTPTAAEMKFLKYSELAKELSSSR